MKQLQLILFRHPKHNMNSIHIITNQLCLDRGLNPARPFLHLKNPPLEIFLIFPAYNLSPLKSSTFLLFPSYSFQPSCADPPFRRIQTFLPFSLPAHAPAVISQPQTSQSQTPGVSHDTPRSHPCKVPHPSLPLHYCGKPLSSSSPFGRKAPHPAAYCSQTAQTDRSSQVPS